MNCRPGDLAIVVRSMIASNLGKIVQVVRPYANGDSHIVCMDSDSMLWLCHTTGSPLRWAGALGIEMEQADAGPIPDRCLRPLRPDADPIPAVHQSDSPIVA